VIWTEPFAEPLFLRNSVDYLQKGLGAGLDNVGADASATMDLSLVIAFDLGLALRILAAAPVPVACKQMILRTALRSAGSLICDTSLVSNLGQIEAPGFDAITATELWFSTSAHMPRGLSLGAVTAGGSLRLTFRYRRALFSASDAAEFAARYAKALDQVASPEAGQR